VRDWLATPIRARFLGSKLRNETAGPLTVRSSRLRSLHRYALNARARSRPDARGRRCLLAWAVVAALGFVALTCASAHAKSLLIDRRAHHRQSPNARLVAARSMKRATAGTPVAPGDPASDFAVSPLVSPRVRTFIVSKSDFARSSLLGRIVVPLVLLVLIGRELLAAADRRSARTFLAYGLPLISLVAMLVFVRFRAYLG
jgi:hypothetical protein